MATKKRMAAQTALDHGKTQPLTLRALVRLAHDRPALKKGLLLIAILVGFAYAPTLRNGFVWDDSALVLRDPLIRSWRLIPEGFRHFLFTDATASDFYRPIQRLTYTVDYALNGLAAPGYHLSNLILHIGAASALLLFLKQTLTNRLALIAALIWAVHPLHSSAVAYVSGRADLLAAAFGFTGLCLACRQKMWPASICFLGAMLSKESGCIFIPLALLFAPGPRLRWAPPLALILAAYLCLRLSAEHVSPPVAEQAGIASRPLLMCRAVAEYAELVVAPIRLHMERNVASGGPANDPAIAQRLARWREWQTLFGAALIAGMALWIKKTNSRWLWAFVIAYLPVSNLFSLNATVAEHWLYVPLAFLLAAAVPLFENRKWAVPLATTIILLFAGRTLWRTFDWKDERTFLERNITDGGDSARMYVQLGVLESNQGNQKAAVQCFQKALEREPSQPFALLGMASAQFRDSNSAAARQYLEKASAYKGLRPQVLEAKAALTFRETGSPDLELLRQAVAAAPNRWPVRKRYLLTLDQQNQTAGAIRELTAFLSEQDFRSDAWVLLSQLLQKAGKQEQAAAAWQQAALYDVHLRPKL